MAQTFVDTDGAALWTTMQGTGQALMLCNGGPGCCDYLESVASMVDDLCQVVRFEQRGCGRSTAAPPYDVATCIADLEAIRRHYRFERWIIGGHSWGADLALAYALTYPERVSGVICMAGGRIHNDREWHKEYDRRRTEEGELQPDYAYPINYTVNEQVSRSWKQYIQQPHLLKQLASLDKPVLFVMGQMDIRPAWPTEQLAALMPNARIEMIAGAAHTIWLTHASELRTSLRRFLEELPG